MGFRSQTQQVRTPLVLTSENIIATGAGATTVAKWQNGWLGGSAIITPASAAYYTVPVGSIYRVQAIVLAATLEGTTGTVWADAWLSDPAGATIWSSCPLRLSAGASPPSIPIGFGEGLEVPGGTQLAATAHVNTGTNVTHVDLAVHGYLYPELSE